MGTKIAKNVKMTEDWNKNSIHVSDGVKQGHILGLIFNAVLDEVLNNILQNISCETLENEPDKINI